MTSSKFPVFFSFTFLPVSPEDGLAFGQRPFGGRGKGSGLKANPPEYIIRGRMLPYLPSADEMDSLLKKRNPKMKMKMNNEIIVRSGPCKIGMKWLVSMKSKVV